MTLQISIPAFQISIFPIQQATPLRDDAVMELRRWIHLADIASPMTSLPGWPRSQRSARSHARADHRRSGTPQEEPYHPAMTSLRMRIACVSFQNTVAAITALATESDAERSAELVSGCFLRRPVCALQVGPSHLGWLGDVIRDFRIIVAEVTSLGRPAWAGRRFHAGAIRPSTNAATGSSRRRCASRPAMTSPGLRCIGSSTRP